MAYGDRKSTRVSFERSLKSYIVGIDGSWRVACLMSDISQTGARLTITDPSIAVTHKEFFLAISTSGAVHRRCEVIRRDGDQLGVRFVEAPPFAKNAARR